MKPGTSRQSINGCQRKSYLHAQDCVAPMLLAVESTSSKVQAYNLGADEYCEIRDSVGWITEHLELSPELVFSGGERGWSGDNPFIFLDTQKIRAFGWQHKYSIKEGALATLDYLRANHWLLEARS
jgi:UDP-glucose 4-epimerase